MKASLYQLLFDNTKIKHQLGIDILFANIYLVRVTLTALAPLGPISISKVTLLFSFTGSCNAFICTKILSCVAKSFIKPYPFS